MSLAGRINVCPRTSHFSQHVVFDHFPHGEIRLHLAHLDFDLLADVGPRNDDDVSPLDTGDAVSLLAEILDFDVAHLADFDWRLRTGGGSRAFLLARLTPRRFYDCDAIAPAWRDRAIFDLLWGNRDVIARIPFDNFGVEQTQ